MRLCANFCSLFLERVGECNFWIRFGDAEKDVGRVCVFLASPDASFVTGDTIMVQGGSGMTP